MIEEHLSVCIIVGLDRVRGGYPFYPPRILTYYDEDSKHWLLPRCPTKHGARVDRANMDNIYYTLARDMYEFRPNYQGKGEEVKFSHKHGEEVHFHYLFYTGTMAEAYDHLDKFKVKDTCYRWLTLEELKHRGANDYAVAYIKRQLERIRNYEKEPTI